VQQQQVELQAQELQQMVRAEAVAVSQVMAAMPREQLEAQAVLEAAVVAQLEILVELKALAATEYFTFSTRRHYERIYI
jgi:hypothetical protein